MSDKLWRFVLVLVLVGLGMLYIRLEEFVEGIKWVEFYYYFNMFSFDYFCYLYG